MKGKRWCLVGLLVSILNFFSGCGSAMSNDPEEVTHFKWYSVATAPRDYPMRIVRGTFYYKGRDVGDNIPSGGTINTGWGQSASVYVKGDEIPPLPDRVEVEFFSYAENQFYHAKFALPYEDILAKFQQRLKDSPEDPYCEFVLGVAPGGAMAVWIKASRTTEVYFGQAERTEMAPNEALELPFKSTAQSDDYVARALAESVTPEQLTRIKTKGAPTGAWARFRNLYKWAPVYKEGKGPIKSRMPAHFLNGESYKIPTRFDETLGVTLRPLPLSLTFRAKVTEDEQPVYQIEFEPFELMEAFEKLGAHEEKVFIEFDAQVPRQNMKIRLYNDSEPKDKQTPREYIELKKFKVKPEVKVRTSSDDVDR